MFLATTGLLQPDTPTAQQLTDGTRCPERGASLFRVLTFSWLNPLLVLGQQTALKHEHLYEMRPEDHTAVTFELLSDAWAKEPVMSLRACDCV